MNIRYQLNKQKPSSIPDVQNIATSDTKWTSNKIQNIPDIKNTGTSATNWTWNKISNILNVQILQHHTPTGHDTKHQIYQMFKILECQIPTSNILDVLNIETF